MPVTHRGFMMMNLRTSRVLGTLDIIVSQEGNMVNDDVRMENDNQCVCTLRDANLNETEYMCL